MNETKIAPSEPMSIPTWMQSFAQYVNYERIRQGLSVASLAELSDVSADEMDAIEGGELPPVQLVIKLADTLMLDPDLTLELVTPYHELFHWIYQRTFPEILTVVTQERERVA